MKFLGWVSSIFDSPKKGRQWSQRFNCLMKKQLLQVKESANRGRGLFAKADIETGQIVLEVEASRFVTYSTFADHPVLGKIVNKTGQKQVEFAYFLAFSSQEKEALESAISVHQYLDRLPPYFHNLVCWSDEELDQLGNPALAAKIKNKKACIRAVFYEIQEMMLGDKEDHMQEVGDEERRARTKRGSRQMNPVLPEKKDKTNYRQIIRSITLDQIMNFVAVIESRNAYYPNNHDTSSAVGALVPELEMFNHSHHSKCRVELAHKAYRVIAESPIFSGEEVFVDYGPFTREEFLEFYGMLPEEEKQNQWEYPKGRARMEGERQLLILKYRGGCSKAGKQESKIQVDIEVLSQIN